MRTIKFHWLSGAIIVTIFRDAENAESKIFDVDGGFLHGATWAAGVLPQSSEAINKAIDELYDRHKENITRIKIDVRNKPYLNITPTGVSFWSKEGPAYEKKPGVQLMNNLKWVIASMDEELIEIINAVVKREIDRRIR